MKLARKHRHSTFSIFHSPFSIDPYKSPFIDRAEQLLSIILPHADRICNIARSAAG